MSSKCNNSPAWGIGKLFTKNRGTCGGVTLYTYFLEKIGKLDCADEITPYLLNRLYQVFAGFRGDMINSIQKLVSIEINLCTVNQYNWIYLCWIDVFFNSLRYYLVLIKIGKRTKLSNWCELDKPILIEQIVLCMVLPCITKWYLKNG